MTYAWQRSPTRSLEQYLDDLCEQLKRLPMTSRARGPLITKIRQIEAELDARQPL
jgi:hypothetical protein